MPEFFKQVFIVLVLYFGELLATKCVSLNNQLCTSRLTLINLNHDELHDYPFMVSLDRCDKCCNTDGSFNRACVPNKIKDVNLEGSNKTKEINESNL